MASTISAGPARPYCKCCGKMPVCVVVESFSSIRSTLFDIFGFDLSGDDEYAKLEFSCGTSVSLSMRQYRLFDENIAELQMRYSLSGGHLLSFKD